MKMNYGYNFYDLLLRPENATGSDTPICRIQ